MGGYFDRGASTGGHDEGYHNRDDVTGPEGVGSATGGPGGVARSDSVPHGVGDGVEQDQENPNIVRAVPGSGEQVPVDETAGTSRPAQADASSPGIIEGSDSERTGTSWGLPGYEDGALVGTPTGAVPEGEGRGEAAPNRNTGDPLVRDELDDVGAWGTMGTIGSPGSPTGNS